MKLLVVGGGGREHALVWNLAQSHNVEKIYCAPGNPGIASIAECIPIAATDILGLKKFALEHKIDLTIVGPEQPLVDGIVDEFESSGLAIFGPSQKAARLEGSKVFAKQFMQRNNIPTARFRTFTEDQYHDAEDHIKNHTFPVVIKADGLAAGKGVTVCLTPDEAFETLRLMFKENAFQHAGSKIVIEEYLEGEEASIFVLTDGNNYVVLPSAQDHKRIFDNDEGKNTGGMGAYSPAPVITEHLLKQIETTIILPTLNGMQKEGSPYKGCLYIGLMINNNYPNVIEYNCRFGDPETQVVLPLIDDDLAELMLESAKGNLTTRSIKLNTSYAVCIVLASGGYPDIYQSGKPISGIEKALKEPNIIIFHAGTKTESGNLVTNGGRVLGVTATGSTLPEAIDRAYHAVGMIRFDGLQYRRDIGKKGLLAINRKGIS